VKTFLWCWIALFTTTVLPFGIAALCGWAPRWTSRRWSRARIQVQGVSLLVLYVAALAHPVFRLSGTPGEDADFLLTATVPALMFLAMGLQGGAGLLDWLNRRHAARPHEGISVPARFADGSRD